MGEHQLTTDRSTSGNNTSQGISHASSHVSGSTLTTQIWVAAAVWHTPFKNSI
jgi:hypothetical protein